MCIVQVYIVHDSDDAVHVQCLAERRRNIEYFFEHHKGSVAQGNSALFLSNRDGDAEYDLFEATLTPKKSSLEIDVGEWNVVLKGSSQNTIDDMTVNRDACTLLRRCDGRQVVQVIPFGDDGKLSRKDIYTIPTPEWALDLKFGPNENYDSEEVELLLSSPVRPTVNAVWHLKELRLDLPTTPISVSNIVERIAASVLYCSLPEEGIDIPITLVEAKATQGKPSPCLLISYGAYGQSLDLDYQSFIIPLLDRSWKIAFCHIRGGGEYGKAWHSAGRGECKQNSVNDLHACCTFLLENGTLLSHIISCGLVHFNNSTLQLNFLFITGIASHGAVSAMAQSAGAIALCGVLNKCPGLIHSVILESPFVDVLNAMSDTSHALTQHEYEEFGNPTSETGRMLLQSICPLHGMKQQEYPSMLICTGRYDLNVPLEGSSRYVEKIRSSNTSKNKCLHWERAFHGHIPSQSEIPDVRALQVAFLLDFVSRK